MGWLWSKQAELVYPIPPAPRTALLIPGFRSKGKVRVFAEGWGERARAFGPQAMAATLGQLEGIDAELTHAIVVLGRIGDRRLTEVDYERLWRRFGVPVFEQIIGDRCEMLAAECEAHDGLHVTEAGRAAGLEVAGVDESLCGCGRRSARIVRGGRSIAARR